MTLVSGAWDFRDFSYSNQLSDYMMRPWIKSGVNQSLIIQFSSSADYFQSPASTGAGRVP
jgi:hypothetical protein